MFKTIEKVKVRSYSDETLKKVNNYFKKHPNLPNKPPVSQIERELRERLEQLKKYTD